MNPTTARLHRVSSSLLRAVPGGANQFGDSNQTGRGLFGTPASGNVGQQQCQQRQQQPPLPPPPPMYNPMPLQHQQQTQHQQQCYPIPGLPPPSRQHSKFMQVMDLLDEEMLDIEVSLKKEDYWELGSPDYQKN